jgi:hypothetical protein
MQRVKETTIIMDGDIIELRRGEFGYFRSTCNNLTCERFIRWDELFCKTCPTRIVCHTLSHHQN